MKIKKQQARTAQNVLLSPALKFELEVNKWAITRNIKKLKSINESIDDDLYGKSLDLCLKNEKDVPIKDDKGNFQFSVGDEKKLRTFSKELLNQEIDFEPYQFRSNEETKKYKEQFMNLDLDFLLSDCLLEEPIETPVLSLTQNGVSA